MELIGYSALILIVAALVIVGGRWRAQARLGHDPSLPRTPRERMIAALGFLAVAVIGAIGLYLSRR